jgi:AcrR family transcriptional regulator
LTQEAVAASQRARLLDAIGHVVAAKGMGAATVADVIAHAGVSRRTFYEQFDRLEDCFVAAYEDGMRRLFAAIREALRAHPGADWRERTRIAIATYLRALAAMPEATRAFTLETLGAGAAAQAQRRRVLAEWVGHWQVLLALRAKAEPGSPGLPEAVLVGLVGGLEEMVREQLERRGARSLAGLAPAATQFALSVLGAGE